MTRYLSTVWVMIVPLLAACNGTEEREPVSAAQLALTAEQNVENALRGAHAAGSFIADSATLAKLLSTSTGCDTSAAPCAAGSPCAPAESTCEDSVTQADLAEGRDKIRDAIDDFVKTLKEDVFTPENLESEDGHSAVYRLSPEYLCKDQSSDVAVPAPAPGGTSAPSDTTSSTLDPDCVKRATDLAPRLRLTSPSNGDVDVALLLTAEQRNPATLELHADSVGVQVDLAELKATLDAAHQDTGSLASMSGKLEFELKRNADLDYSFRFNVLSTLSVNTVDDLMQQIAFSLAGNKPSFEIRLDGNAKQVTGTYHFGAFGLKGPLNALYHHDESASGSASGVPAPAPEPAPTKTYTGIIDLLVAGIDGSVTFDGNRDRLALHALGLGDASSTLKHDGNLLAKLDLNPSANRHFDLSVERNNDQTTFSISPTFDLNLLLNFAPLQNQIDDIPAYALSDNLHFFFQGDSPSLRAEKDQLRVLAGTLNITSQSVPSANLSVAPGMCLLQRPSDAPKPAHELLGEFVSGTCK